MHKFTNANTQIQIEAMASNAPLQGLTVAKDFTQRHGGYTVMIFLTSGHSSIMNE